MSKQPLIDQLDQAISGILANPDFAPPSIDPDFAELVRVARDLRDLPRSDFKASLKADLERKATMSTTTATSVTFRPGFRTITPYLLPALIYKISNPDNEDYAHLLQSDGENSYTRIHLHIY